MVGAWINSKVAGTEVAKWWAWRSDQMAGTNGGGLIAEQGEDSQIASTGGDGKMAGIGKKWLDLGRIRKSKSVIKMRIQQRKFGKFQVGHRPTWADPGDKEPTERIPPPPSSWIQHGEFLVVHPVPRAGFHRL